MNFRTLFFILLKSERPCGFFSVFTLPSERDTSPKISRPKDINFVQSHKAIEHSVKALRENGVLIFFADSGQGFPSVEYNNWLNLKTSKAVEEKIRETGYSIPGQTIHSCLKKAEKYQIIWITKQNFNEIRNLGIKPVNNFDEAFKVAIKCLPGNFTYYVISDGFSTLPEISN